LGLGALLEVGFRGDFEFEHGLRIEQLLVASCWLMSGAVFEVGSCE
jgi:hypothetical protein